MSRKVIVGPVCDGVENPEIFPQYCMFKLSLVQYVWSMLILYRVIEHQSFGLSPVNLYWQSPTNPISSQAEAKLFQPTLAIRKKPLTLSP